MTKGNLSTIPDEIISSKIYFIREKKIMLDRDLAVLYGVTTGNLNKAVKRNIKRFPDDFMFQLTKPEYDNYILAPEIENLRSRVMSDTLSRGFTHYYDQLNTGRKLTFKCLRKTYIANLEIFMGTGNTKSITGHSDNQVIEKN